MSIGKKVPITLGTIDRFAQGGPTKAQMRRMAIQINKEVAGPLAHDYILDNFLVGGRPRFTANSATWKKWKSVHGYPTRPLWMTGTLFQKAILDPVIKATENSVILSPRNPTDLLKKSMNRLHDGGGGIPERPWTHLLTAQEARVKKITALAWKSVLNDYIVTGKLRFQKR